MDDVSSQKTRRAKNRARDPAVRHQNPIRQSSFSSASTGDESRETRSSTLGAISAPPRLCVAAPRRLRFRSRPQTYRPARARLKSTRARASRAIARRAASPIVRAHLNDDRPPVPTASLVTLGGGTLKSLPGLMLIARALAKSAGSACVDARASVTRHRASADVAKRRARARDISRRYQSRSADARRSLGVARARANAAKRDATNATRATRRRDRER